jgi:hypothetical protein
VFKRLIERLWSGVGEDKLEQDDTRQLFYEEAPDGGEDDSILHVPREFANEENHSPETEAYDASNIRAPAVRVFVRGRLRITEPTKD